MLDILIKNITFIEAQQDEKKSLDIGIKKGKIAFIKNSSINDNDPEAKHVIHQDGLHASIGWFDIGAHLNDPGHEQKDTIYTLNKSALKGGFTDILLLPETIPIADNPQVLQALSQNLKTIQINTHLIANCQKDKNLSQILSMSEAGAKAFTFGLAPFNNLSLLCTTLNYLKTFDGLLIYYPHTYPLLSNGQMHEGKTSTLLGLEGLPAIAEKMAIDQIVSLSEYFGTKVHIAYISTKESLRSIEYAKEKGIAVTCGLAAHQFAFSAEDLISYDSNLKVNPPFRNQEDLEDIRSALDTEIIDVISSAHAPQDIDNKRVEFALAEFGILGLETAFSLVNTLKKRTPLSKIINKLTYQPRKILNLPVPKLAVGEWASFTLFNPDIEWTFKPEDIGSLSKNTPFVGYTFRGKPLGVINRDYYYLDDELKLKN